jgi:RimJ/RimL family protein N-acetyltransferase
MVDSEGRPGAKAMAIVEQAALSGHPQPRSEPGSSEAGLAKAQGFNIQDLTLTGRRAKLAPLIMDWRNPLIETASADPAIFRWHVAPMDSPAAISAWIEKALAERAAQTALPFVIIEAGSGGVVGSTRFFNIDPPNLKAEIGFTWIVASAQRTGVNREAKYMMLRHAFETWKVRRLEFKAHADNLQSRTALLRLGAIEEGTLRNHMVMPDGSARHSVYFSIIDSEWPGMKGRLENRLYGDEPSNA